MQGNDGGEVGGGAFGGGGGRRKTWDRAAAPVVFKETEGRNAALSAAGVDPSYRDYLGALQVRRNGRTLHPPSFETAPHCKRNSIFRRKVPSQEKNRAIREMRTQEETRLAAVQERERGFELNFAGANEVSISPAASDPKILSPSAADMHSPCATL